MNRSNFSEIINNKHYSTINLPNVQKLENEIYITTNSGDRLDLLANKYYGDSNLWWVIVHSNNLPGDSMFVESGKLLRIFSDIVDYFDEINKK